MVWIRGLPSARAGCNESCQAEIHLQQARVPVIVRSSAVRLSIRQIWLVSKLVTTESILNRDIATQFVQIMAFWGVRTFFERLNTLWIIPPTKSIVLGLRR